MIKQDVELAALQLDQMHDGVEPEDIFITLEEKKWRVMSIELEGEDHVKLSLVDAEFDFGDGYYVINEQEEDSSEDVLEINDPLIAQLFKDILLKWEGYWNMECLESLGPIKQLYVDSVNRNGRKKEVVDKIHTMIKHHQKGIEESQEEASIKHNQWRINRLSHAILLIDLEENLKEARKIFSQYKNIPEWIDEDFEWYIEIDGVKYWVDYIDPVENSIALTHDETKEQEEFTNESKNWAEIVEELAITAPSKIW